MLIAIVFALWGCDDLLQNGPENSEKEWVKVLFDDASIEKKNADYVISGSNADWTASVTLLDAVEEGAGKYTQYKGSITSLETNEKEILAVEESAVFKMLDANTYQLVAKMRGAEVYYEITFEGTLQEDSDIEVKPELEKEAISCTNATIDTISNDLVFNASNNNWTVSITLPNAAIDGVGKYFEYDGTITNTLDETEVLKVEDIAVFSLVNDKTFKLVAEMEGKSKLYAITLTGARKVNSDDPNGPDDPDIPIEPLSPDEQKDFLVQVGEQLINMFNPADQKKAVELADDLYYKYKKYDWDAIGDALEDEINDVYSSEFESFFGMPRRMIDAINGKRKASMEDLEILLTLSKFGRVIEFDDKKKTIIITKTDDPSIVAKFSDTEGTKCELKVWGEGKEINGSYTYSDYHWEYPQIWDEYWQEWVNDWDNGTRVEDGERTIKVKVPTTIKMHFKQGSSSLVSFTFTWDSNIKDYVNTSLNLQVINLVFEEETKVSTTEASAVFSFNYGTQDVITAAVNLPKYALIDWEGGNDIIASEGEEWLEKYADKYKSLLGKVGKGEVKLDILGKIQLMGGVTDGAALVDAFYNWKDQYYHYIYEDYERTYTYTWVYEYWDYWYNEYVKEYIEEVGSYNAWWERPYYSLQARQDQCNFLNKYAYLSVFYNKTATEQAKVLLDTHEEDGIYDPVDWMRDNDEYTNLPDPINYTCYNIEPIMYFPQEETSIAVMTYFNSSKFLGLIDLVEDLANSYIALDKHNLIFDEDFKIELDY